MRNKQFVALANQMYVSTFAGHIDTITGRDDTLKTQIDAVRHASTSSSGTDHATMTRRASTRV